MGRPRLLHGRRHERQATVQSRHPAAERDRITAPRSRARADVDGRAAAAPADAGRRGAVAAGHGSCRYRYPGAGREASRRDRGQDASGPRPGRVHRAGLAVERRVRREDPRPDAPARRRRRLVTRALHDGRGPVQGRTDDLQATVRRRSDLPGRADHELVPDGSHRAVGYRGRSRRGRRRTRLDPVRRRRRLRCRRDDPRRDDARRHRDRRAPGRSALPASDRHADRVAARRPDDSRSSPTRMSTQSSAPARSRSRRPTTRTTSRSGSGTRCR